MNTLSLRSEICSRVAQLIAMDVRDTTQIAQATGLPESHVLQIMQSAETVAQVQALRTKQLDDARALNNGWDAVEEDAIGTVLEALRNGADQEYALRAAAVANKAQRRGANGLRNTLSPVAGATAIIDLKAVYIERLQQMTVAQDRVREVQAQEATMDITASDPGAGRAPRIVASAEGVEGAVQSMQHTSATHVAASQRIRKRVNVLPLQQLDRVLNLGQQGGGAQGANSAEHQADQFTTIFQQLRPAFQAALAL